MDADQITVLLPGLRRYARLLTGDAWAADDLVQDTLERACRKWQLWRAGSDLRAWLFTVMHHLYLNQRRSQPAPGQWVDIDTLAEPAQPHAPAHELQLDLARCLLRLPPEQRAVLLLVTVEDMPYAQAAQVLQLPLGTVMSRLSRARSRLRELMDAAPAPHPATAGTPATPPSPPHPALRRLK